MKPLRENKRDLTFKPNADILSDMKTFTVRDLDRRPAEVLDACERDGEVKIRRRSGRSFTLKSDEPPAPKITFGEWLDQINRRRRKLFPDGPVMTPEQAREFDRLIASEDRLL